MTLPARSGGRHVNRTTRLGEVMAEKHLATTVDRTTLGGFLTPERRKALYGIASALMTAGVVYGIVTPDQLANAADVVAAVIGLLTGVVAFLHTGGEYKAPARDVEG